MENNKKYIISKDRYTVVEVDGDNIDTANSVYLGIQSCYRITKGSTICWNKKQDVVQEDCVLVTLSKNKQRDSETERPYIIITDEIILNRLDREKKRLEELNKELAHSSDEEAYC